jgi:hypothetical protein
MIGLRSTYIAAAMALLLALLSLGQCQRARTAGADAWLSKEARQAALVLKGPCAASNARACDLNHTFGPNLTLGSHIYRPTNDANWDISAVSTPSCKGLLHQETDVTNINRFPLPDEQTWLSAERQIRDLPRYRDPSKVTLTVVL